MADNYISIARIAEDIVISDLDNERWGTAEHIRVSTSWSGKEAPAERHFDFRSLWTDEMLYVRFDAAQHEPLIVNPDPQLETKTMELWHRDVCELFIAPDRNVPERYAEFEIAPTGEWLDLTVDWRNEEPRDWSFDSGIECATRILEDLVVMAFSVPWDAFSRSPAAGDVWLGNIFRQVGAGKTRGYLAWQPTGTDEPSFHEPEAFGEFHFADRIA